MGQFIALLLTSMGSGTKTTTIFAIHHAHGQLHTSTYGSSWSRHTNVCNSQFDTLRSPSSKGFQTLFYINFPSPRDPVQPSHQLPQTTMSSSQPYYIVSSAGKLFAIFIPRVLGVFSTQALAVALVERIAPRYVQIPDVSKPRIVKYHGDDGAIKIVPQHSDIVGTSTTFANTVFLAIDDCGNRIVETNILGTAHDAWAACEAMKHKCGDYWEDEKEWTDNNGRKHGEAEFNITTSSTPAEGGDNVSQQLFGLRTTGLLKHHWYVKEVVIDEEQGWWGPRYLVQV